MTILKQHGVDVECKDEDGGTPLSVAARIRNTNAVKVLLRESKNKRGVYSLGALYKLSEGEIGIGRLRGEKFEAYTTPPLHAVRAGIVEVAKVLLTCESIEPDLSCNTDHNTVLHLCTNEQASEMVPLLINAPGFNQEKKNAAGMTPLALAAYKGHCHVVEAVLKSGKANVNVEDRFDRNILDLAVCGRNPTVRLVQLLLKTNCFRFSFDQRRPRGRAFAIAAGKKDLYQDISNLLESYYEGQTQQNLAEEDVES